MNYRCDMKMVIIVATVRFWGQIASVWQAVQHISVNLCRTAFDKRKSEFSYWLRHSYTGYVIPILVTSCLDCYVMPRLLRHARLDRASMYPDQK